jgi:hypothetical protein
MSFKEQLTGFHSKLMNPYTAQAQPDSLSVINLCTAAAQHSTLHMLQMHVLESLYCSPNTRGYHNTANPRTMLLHKILYSCSLRHYHSNAWCGGTRCVAVSAVVLASEA